MVYNRVQGVRKHGKIKKIAKTIAVELGVVETMKRLGKP